MPKTSVIKPPRKLGFLPRWRKMTWLFNLFNLAMLIWVIAASAATTKHDDSICGTLSKADCHAAQDVGSGLAITALIIIWVVGFVLLALLWIMTRPSRHCPVCGSGIKRGHTICKACGHDFRPAPPQGPYQTVSP